MSDLSSTIQPKRIGNCLSWNQFAFYIAKKSSAHSLTTVWCQINSIIRYNILRQRSESDYSKFKSLPFGWTQFFALEKF